MFSRVIFIVLQKLMICSCYSNILIVKCEVNSTESKQYFVGEKMKFLLLLLITFNVQAHNILDKVTSVVRKHDNSVVIFDLDDTLFDSSSR